MFKSPDDSIAESPFQVVVVIGDNLFFVYKINANTSRKQLTPKVAKVGIGAYYHH